MSYKEYQTPTSSDVLVNAFRRWLDKAAKATRNAGEEQAARAATGGTGVVYSGNRPRADLLDRYASHTASCSICQSALKSMKIKRDRLLLISNALVGATGASCAITSCTIMFLLMTKLILRQWASNGLVFRTSATVLFPSVLVTVASWVGVKKTTQQKTMLDKEIQRFYFEDYVHADKE